MAPQVAGKVTTVMRVTSSLLNSQSRNIMFEMNAAPIEGHPDTNDNAQQAPVRLRCICGDCPECDSASVLPLIVISADGEVNPTAGAGDDADADQPEEHPRAGKTRIAASSAPAAIQSPASPTRAQGASGIVSSDPDDRALRSISHATMTAAVTKFESIAGQMPLGHTTPEAVKAFVDGLRREGKSNASVLRYLRALKAVTQLLGAFEWLGTSHSNPFAQEAERVRLP
jgi:hypothetical protein